ncbi:MAG: ArsR/SmtB family transcription factor [Pleomorphochaeta sp.]
MISEKEFKRAEIQAQMFKALAHPMRVYILEKLKEKSWCVCELAQEIGLPKSAVSKHLSQLKEAGLVNDSRMGTRVEYSLIAPCILELTNCAAKTVLENKKKQLEI